jgi:hypothetical protein
MDIHVGQDAFEVREKWWKWSVWLEGSDEDLDQVKSVEYILHPTFPKPVINVSNRENSFRLKASGWGEFLINIHVHMKDEEEIALQHWLQLWERTSSAQYRRPAVFLSYSVADTYYAEVVGDKLEEMGFKVIVVDQLRQALEDGGPDRRTVNLGVIFVSDAHSPFVGREIDALEEANVPLILVLLGADTEAPKIMAGFDTLRISDEGDLDEVSNAIGYRLKIAPES